MAGVGEFWQSSSLTRLPYPRTPALEIKEPCSKFIRLPSVTLAIFFVHSLAVPSYARARYQRTLLKIHPTPRVTPAVTLAIFFVLSLAVPSYACARIQRTLLKIHPTPACHSVFSEYRSLPMGNRALKLTSIRPLDRSALRAPVHYFGSLSIVGV